MCAAGPLFYLLSFDNFMNSRQDVLVTGGAGFIGSHLCEALLGRGLRVTCLDNFVNGRPDNIAHLPGLLVAEGDVNEAATWHNLRGRKFAAVFHYAALVGVKQTEEEPLKVLADVRGLQHLADFAAAGGAEKIIFASSSEVYGQPQQVPLPEEGGVYGWSPYTVVKLYGEQLMAGLWRKRGVPTVALRFFNVYGPRQRNSAYGFVVATFLEQVQRGVAPTVFGDGEQTRDFVFISDNIEAALAALDNEAAAGMVINVGTGRETTIANLARLVSEAAGRPELKPQFLPARAGEIKRRCATVDRMQQRLGVSCKIGLEEGIGLLLAQRVAPTLVAS